MLGLRRMRLIRPQAHDRHRCDAHVGYRRTATSTVCAKRRLAEGRVSGTRCKAAYARMWNGAKHVRCRRDLHPSENLEIDKTT